MKSEQLLNCLGNVNDRYITEAIETKTAEKKYLHHIGKKKKSLIPAACIAACILFGSSIVLADTMGIDLFHLFSSDEESGFDIKFQIEKVSDDVFIGEVSEAHAVIRQQFEDYEPYMSWYPGSFERSFESVDEVSKYLGVNFIEHPISEPAEDVMLSILGGKNGRFKQLMVLSYYNTGRFRFSVSHTIYSGESDYPINLTGKSVIDGSAFDLGLKSSAYEQESISAGIRAAEYETYTSKKHRTQNNTDVLIVQSSPNENDIVSLDGFFVKGCVFYNLHVIAQAGCTEEGMNFLMELLEKY